MDFAEPAKIHEGWGGGEMEVVGGWEVVLQSKETSRKQEEQNYCFFF